MAEQLGDQALALHESLEPGRLRADLIAARITPASAPIHITHVDKAIGEYRAELQQAPRNRELEFAQALAYLKKGDVDQAAGLFSSLLKSQPDDAGVATLLGDCDLRLGRYSEAVSLLAPLEKANPGNLYLKWVLGSALIRTGQIYEGTERVERVAQQTHSAEMYMVAAEANLKIRRFGQSRSDLEAAKQFNPHLPGLDMLNGAIAESEGELRQAAGIFQKVLNANPNEFQAHLHLGTILYAERQLEAAQLQLQRALEVNPTSSSARYQLARVERAQGRMDAARRDFEQAERDDPDWLPPHIELSALYYRLNRPQDGARERKIVERLRAEQMERQSKSNTVSLQLPAP